MHLLPQDDERFLQRALALATDAAAFASPNPTVGCVLTRNGEVVGEGAHFYDNYDHAEVAALKQAQASGHSVRGATAYVTLEPCAHHGRTGPCAVALIQAGIARCVIATVDPNEQVSGKGTEILRDAGIVVDIAHPASPAADAARRLNDAFAFSIQHGRPFVTLKAAVSLDGFLAPPSAARVQKEPVWLTGEAARAEVQQLRHIADAVITGIGTVLADDPTLTDRTGAPRRRPLLRAVIDSQLRTPPNAKLLHTSEPAIVIFTTGAAPEQNAKALELAGAEVERLTSKSGRVDIQNALQRLHERNVRSTILESGSALNAAFLKAELVDKVVLYYSDIELGRGSVPFAEHMFSPYALQERMRSVSRKSFQHASGSQREDIRVVGYLHDPWAGI